MNIQWIELKRLYNLVGDGAGVSKLILQIFKDAREYFEMFKFLRHFKSEGCCSSETTASHKNSEVHINYPLSWKIGKLSLWLWQLILEIILHFLLSTAHNKKRTRNSIKGCYTIWTLHQWRRQYHTLGPVNTSITHMDECIISSLLDVQSS